MTRTRISLTTVAAFFVSQIMAVLIHGFVLAADYEPFGRALGRPSWLKAPSFALRLVLGEMADALVLGGQRVIPDVARRHGFVFRHPTVESALKEIYS